jgi:hypothetical protein
VHVGQVHIVAIAGVRVVDDPAVVGAEARVDVARSVAGEPADATARFRVLRLLDLAADVLDPAPATAGSAATSGFAAATETAAAPPAAARSVRKCRRSTRLPCEVVRSDPDLSRLAMIVPFLSGFMIPVHSPR